VNQGTKVVSSITLESHTITKQAGVWIQAASKSSKPRPDGYMYRGVNASISYDHALGGFRGVTMQPGIYKSNLENVFIILGGQ